ncbi:MAG TPA: magnesium transporter, partial [Gemmatimonadaceae bacterium]|nr:magnesium transporter [Gemmatimonadaceae bacterium]
MKTPPHGVRVDEYEERPLAALLAPDILVMLEESPDAIPAETEELHANDLATIAEALPRESVVAFLNALPVERAADVLEYLDEELRTEVLESMTPHEAAELVTEMTPDDRADALEELEEESIEEILSEIPAAERAETEKLLAYEPDTAGGLMTTEFVSVSEDTPVDEALAAVRRIARSERREAMNAIYTTDASGRVQGVMSLRELLAAPEGAKVSDIAWEEVVTVPVTADREEVARLTREYDLVAVPVVDQNDVIQGVVTVDDVIDALVEEHTEDVQRFGGMEALDEPYAQIGFVGMIRKRAPWLAALFIGEMLTTIPMKHFEGELQKAIVLGLFIPLIISSGGNSGSQATSLIIRSLALEEVRLRDWWRVFLRELPSGLVLGVILGILGVIRILVWQGFGIAGGYGPHYKMIALAIGVSLIGVVAFGSVVGSMLPFVLRRLGFDPASASAPFVATLVDVTGITIYFYVALL